MKRLSLVSPRRFSTPAFWSRRLRRTSRKRRRAIYWSEFLRWLAERNKAYVAVRQLFVASLGTLLLVGSGIFLLEVTSFMVRAITGNQKIPVFSVLDSTSDGSVSAFVGAGVAVAATLLGLYYATVGVVASTIYKDVSGEVRDLFVRERSGEIYIRSLVLTLAGGLVLLVMRALGYYATGLSLIALAALAVMTSVWLMVLGQRLFGFFDPSLLSRALSGRVMHAIRTASDPKSRDNDVRQIRAHYEAYTSLATYVDIVHLIEGSSLRDARAPLAITRQLLAILTAYSVTKDAVPTDSKWWDQIPKHQNWLTIDSTKLDIAIRTSVGFAPEKEPDFLWLEKKIAELLQITLTAAFRARGGADALASADSVSTLVANLTARLQAKEALTIEVAWSEAVARIANPQETGDAAALGSTAKLNQMAAAERLVLPLTQMWLGFVHAAGAIQQRDLPREFARALRDPAALYQGTLPTATRHMLEQFAAAITREKRVEGRVVTPSWWINHYAARSMADELLQTEAAMLDAVHGRTFKRLAHLRSAGREDLAAVVGMASLELLHKIDVHRGTVRAAELKLRSYRNLNTDNEQWPEPAANPLDPASDRRRMLQEIAISVPALRRAELDAQEPDLYGQAYQFIFNGTFDAILEGHHETAAALYAACFLEMDHVRGRLMSDLKNSAMISRMTYSSEPLIGCMELAGYALLMQELDGKGIWKVVKGCWDQLFENNPQSPEILMTAASLVEGSSAMTTGGLERSRRSMALNELFESRGIRKGDWNNLGTERKPPHPSAIVSALIPSYYGIHDDLHALFIAEYLVHHLPEGTNIGHQAKSLRKQISRYRVESSRPSESGPGHADARG